MQPMVDNVLLPQYIACKGGVVTERIVVFTGDENA